MGFKYKSYGLNLLIVPWLQIKLQLSCNYRVNQLVTKHLNIQGKLDSR